MDYDMDDYFWRIYIVKFSCAKSVWEEKKVCEKWWGNYYMNVKSNNYTLKNVKLNEKILFTIIKI